MRSIINKSGEQVSPHKYNVRFWHIAARVEVGWSALSEEKKSQSLSQQLRVNLSCGLLLNGEQVKSVFQCDDPTRYHHAQSLSRLIFLIKGRKNF